MKIDIKSRWDNSVIVSIEVDTIKDAIVQAIKGGANLEDAYLRGANLRGADLEDADLSGANLRGADLRGVEHYGEDHDIFAELVRHQKVDMFTEAEWAMIGQITLHRLCWNSIGKRFGESFLRVLEVLRDAGFGGFHGRYKKIQEEP